MSDTEKRREAIDSVAKDFAESARRSGNSSYTYEQARERVADAVRAGDRKRENGNR